MTRFYGELAPLWPLVSPVEDYAAETAELIDVLRARAPQARTLLELGSGGGHVAHYLKRAFECHLTDLSEPMLECSRRLNPECAHAVGDMRTLDLGRTFDVVLAHDAIDYMLSEDDLRAVFDTAWRHLAPGGLACFIPDDLADTYEGGTDVSGVDGPDGRGVRLFEWAEPAVPGRSTVDVHYTFLVRDPGGDVRNVYERHTTGLFSRATWEHLLAERGFSVEVAVERTEEDRAGRLLFLARKPSSATAPQPTSRDELTAQLRQLGLLPGDVVMIHASLRRLGPVEGGAAGVIDALRSAVGPEGTLLMVLGADDDEPFDALRTPVDVEDMGLLAEVFRTYPDVSVNDHPADRFGAIGPEARLLLEPTPLDDYHGPGSVLERLTARGGRVLRLGANADTVTLTHYAEYLADVPDKVRVRRRYVRADTGELWIESLDDTDGIARWAHGDYFPQIFLDYRASGAVRVGRVGQCEAELFDARPFVAFAVAWMNEHLGRR